MCACSRSAAAATGAAACSSTRGTLAAPTAHNPQYGFMNWFLNTNRELLPSAPAESFVHFGAGTNLVYVDPVNDLVVVARWIERGDVDAFIGRVLGALAPQ